MPRSHNLLPALLLALALPASAAPKPTAAVRGADVDSTCAPCRDFDRFANGPWTSRTTLPAGYSDYGAFDELYDRNEAVLRRILETALAAPRAKADRNTTMLRDYYGACMDSAGAERDGGRPIVGLLADLDGLTSTKDLGRQVAWLHQHGINALFGFGAEQDDRNSEAVIGTMQQGGLGLPERGRVVSDCPSAAITCAPIRPRPPRAPSTSARPRTCCSSRASRPRRPRRMPPP